MNSKKKVTFIICLIILVSIIMLITIKYSILNCITSTKDINTFVTLCNVILTLCLLITTIIYTRLTGKLVASEFGPKLYVLGKIEEAENKWDKSIMKEFGSILLKEQGLVYKDSDKKWEFEVANNGNGVATNIDVIYKIVAYKHEIDLDEKTNSINNFRPLVFKESTKTIHIDYLPPGKSVTFTIFYMGTFPKVDLIVSKLTSDQKNFINKPVTVSKYFNDEFNYIVDSFHLRKLLGLIKED
jgi:hypothetical protein